MHESAVEIGGRRVPYVEAGAGPTVVIVHGLGLAGSIFRGHCRALAAAGFHAIAPDLPGFGGTAGPRFGMSVPATARWLLSFADAAGVDRAVWLGHSLAAQAALETAVQAPHRTIALVLATPTGAPGRTRLLRQVRAFAIDILREPLTMVPAVAKRYIRSSPTAYVGTWVKAACDHPITKASRVRCPTLLVAGRRDPMVSDEYMALLYARLADARLTRLHGAGHGIVFHRRVEFLRVLIAFLRNVMRGTVAEP